MYVDNIDSILTFKPINYANDLHVQYANVSRIGVVGQLLQIYLLLCEKRSSLGLCLL